MNAPSFHATTPAAEQAMRTEETLDSLRAAVAEIFAGMPVLLGLLMRLFAMLRDAAGRVAPAVVVPETAVPDTELPDTDAANIGYRTRAVSGVRASGGRPSAVQVRKMTDLASVAAVRPRAWFRAATAHAKCHDDAVQPDRNFHQKSDLRTGKIMSISLRYRNINTNKQNSFGCFLLRKEQLTSSGPGDELSAEHGIDMLAQQAVNKSLTTGHAHQVHSLLRMTG